MDDKNTTPPIGRPRDHEPNEHFHQNHEAQSRRSQSMTSAQRSYLKSLSDEAGEEFDERLTKADASKRIDELQQRTGRGISH
jgi:hypothetical protein